jgi:outer membrane protein TolC
MQQEPEQTAQSKENISQESRKKNEGERVLSETLNLERTITLALKNNPDVEKSKASLKRAQAILDEANSAFWPRLSFYSEYVQGDSPSSFWFKKIDQRKVQAQDINEPDDFNDPGWFENFETGIEGTFNVFRGGRDLLGRKIANTGKKIHRLQKLQVINQLKSSVINAFYNAQAAREAITIAEQSVRIVQKDLEQTQVRYSAGGALKSDLLSMQVRLSLAQEDLIKAENRYQRSLSILANLLGYDADRDLKLTPAQQLQLTRELPGSYQEAIVYALMHRPESNEIRQRVIKRKMTLDKAKSYYLPTVNVVGKYYHDDPDLSFDQDRENWTVGIKLYWDVFSGLSRQAKIRQAEATLSEMCAQDQKTVQAIQLEVRNSLLQLKEAKARQEVAQESVRQAQESLRLVRKQYQGGSSTITRYLHAELDLQKTRYRSSLAFYAKQKAMADLARALGFWAQETAN